MIRVDVLRNRKGKYVGFDCEGHAGYADSGEDIVCAGVSALVINTVNAIACFTDEKLSAGTEEATGRITARFYHPAGHDAELLVKSLVLGLQGIQEQYGTTYITIHFKEV